MTQAQKTKAAERVNGVDVGTLSAAIGEMKKEPSLGQFRFRAHNKWIDGMKNRSSIQDFYGAGKEDDSRTEPYVFDCDEPPVLAGDDTGANPVEYVLHALAGCATTTMVAHSASRGIEIEAVESELEGDIDVRGFLGLADDVEKGYREIRLNFRVKSDASAEQLRSFAEMSPVFNTLSQPVRVVVNVEKMR